MVSAVFTSVLVIGRKTNFGGNARAAQTTMSRPTFVLRRSRRFNRRATASSVPQYRLQSARRDSPPGKVLVERRIMRRIAGFCAIAGSGGRGRMRGQRTRWVCRAPRSGRRAGACRWTKCPTAGASGPACFLRGVPPRAAVFFRGVPPRAPRPKAPGPAPLVVHATTALGRWRSQEAFVPWKS